ncbi:hypothetical protein NCAS_0B04880 [Naumovozyma castellii]|uniref:Checkpoint protein RAD24-like helical bundle domain-containing protein n=1 Tax=Naumovozyma castellii TaxID=27288 RepID=G0V9F6_NAUCA|nr:hypothetical protein NCAS_0B04880 [Naumovozyma castellii CBS 4309]CCC68572.1 hypothetical protein NCAS_0B04880 [Naumovozyma castellii CBS 4309]
MGRKGTTNSVTDDMVTQPVLSKPPSLQYSLSSLSSQISKWNAASRPTSPNRSPTKITPNRKEEEYLPWYEQYQPRTLDEVVIHKRKLKDVTEALENMLNGNSDSRILLLTGPSGCSKSTVVTKLADFLIPKYRNSYGMRTTLRNREKTNVVEYGNDSILNGQPQTESFAEFLRQAKYRIGSNLSLILVEDLPNVFHSGTRYSFQNILLEWLYSSDETLPPLVICLTECELENDSNTFNTFNIDSTFTAETILGKQILSHPRLKRIKFNPINMTLMKKHLMKLCSKNQSLLEQNKKWSHRTEFVTHLCSNCGDIRSGISALEFWAKSRHSIPLETREQSISYFHAIGKIIYGSHDIRDDHEMINSLILGSKGLLGNDTFKLGLLENYGSFNMGKFDVKIAAQLTDAFSESDMMNRSSESFEYTVRKTRSLFSTLNDNNNRHGGTNFPREWKIRKSINEFKIESSDYINVSLYKYNESHHFKDIILEYGFYGPYIRSLRNYKKKALQHYIESLSNDLKKQTAIMDQNEDTLKVDDSIDILNRIGGNIKAVGTEHLATSEDDSEQQIRRSLDHLMVQRDTKLKRLIEAKEEQELHEEGLIEGDDELLLEDRIIDSDEEDDEDDSLYDLLTQQEPRSSADINESLSDSDLEELDR